MRCRYGDMLEFWSEGWRQSPGISFSRVEARALAASRLPRALADVCIQHTRASQETTFLDILSLLDSALEIVICVEIGQRLRI